MPRRWSRKEPQQLQEQARLRGALHSVSSECLKSHRMVSHFWLPRSSQEVLGKLKTKGIAIRVASPKLVMEEAPESYKDVTQARAFDSPAHPRRACCT